MGKKFFAKMRKKLLTAVGLGGILAKRSQGTPRTKQTSERKLKKVLDKATCVW
jgi:hypothetical protein